MLILRAADDRGHFDFGWLSTYHSFSFGDYYDLNHMGFRALRVINEDWIQPSQGFGTHPHRDMEILTWVLEGALRHRDSLGHGGLIRPGEAQRMTAGTGIYHSEFNASDSEPVHLLQIWILPQASGLKPSYEQKLFTEEERHNSFRLIASSDGREGSLTIHQDTSVYAALMDARTTLSLPLKAHRHAWVQVAKGALDLKGFVLKTGDGAAISEEDTIMAQATERSEILFFDLG